MGALPWVDGSATGVRRRTVATPSPETESLGEVRCPVTGISARPCAPELGGLSSRQTIKRLIVIEVGPRSCWTGTVSVTPAATAALIGCSRGVMFRNRANSAGTVAKRAALTVNGPTCVSRDIRMASGDVVQQGPLSQPRDAMVRGMNGLRAGVHHRQTIVS
jgi:hypothetical protein